MANKEFKTYAFPPAYKPTTLDDHKNDGNGKGIEVLKPTVTHHNSPPTITHGDIQGWRNNDRYSLANSQGTGWHSKDRKTGCIKTGWGKTGASHTEIFRVGADSGYWWTIGKDYEHTGVGFEMCRQRLDSTNNNPNAEKHCIHLRRWGVEFIQLKGGTTKFWSSTVLNQNGNFNGGSIVDGRLTQFYFVQHYFKNAFFDPSYVVKALWFNCVTNGGTGDATTEVFLYNMRFYHDMHASANSGNRWLRNGWRTLDNRGRIMITE